MNDGICIRRRNFMQKYQVGLTEATRVTSEKLKNAIAPQNPTFISGTA